MDFSNKKRESNASEQGNERAREMNASVRSVLARNYELSHVTHSQVSPEEHFLVDMLSQITERLKQEYNYSDEEILKLWSNESLLVPVAIFANGLSPAEAIAKFLKENHQLSYEDISKLIGRDQRGVWANYKRSSKKMPAPLQIANGISVPVAIFNSEKSVLEALVSYLKDVKKMRNRKIAQLLKKNSANIWTVYNRAKKKSNNNGHKNEY